MAALSILVTGSSGFIGTHVVRHLHESGHLVTALDCAAPKEELPPGVRFHLCDIREGLLPNKKFDAVVHLAALAGVRQSIDRKLDYEFTNVIGTIRLLEHCRRIGIPHFVFASSSSVYGPDAPLPFSEDGPTNPRSPYALTKLHCEHWGQLYSKLHDIRFIALRFFSVWGPGQRPDLAMEAFRRRIEKGQPIIINGDGSQRRDLTHVFDVVRAVELAIHWQGEGATALNIGTGENHSVMDMAKAAAALHFSGSSFTDFTPAATHENPHPADLPETRASLINTRKTLNWEPGIFFPIGPVSSCKKV